MSFGDSFLRYPDLFPARRAGEPWGDGRLRIDFVGGPYFFSGLCQGQIAAIIGRFGELCSTEVDGDDAAVSAELFRVHANEFRRFELEGWTYTFDRGYDPEAVRLAGYEFMGRIDWPAGLGGSLWTPLTDGMSFVCQFENFFRVLVAYRLLDLGGVLLHSAGIVSKGLAYLFLGPSGAGKSTISRISLASGRLILSDDMNALCPAGEDQVVAEKLPFAGDLGRTPTPRASYPLNALYRLRQGDTALREMSAASAIAFLVACAPFVNADPFRCDRLTDNLLNLVRRFDIGELTFALEEDFWPLLEDPVPESGVSVSIEG